MYRDDVIADVLRIPEAMMNPVAVLTQSHLDHLQAHKDLIQHTTLGCRQSVALVVHLVVLERKQPQLIRTRDTNPDAAKEDDLLGTAHPAPVDLMVMVLLQTTTDPHQTRLMVNQYSTSSLVLAKPELVATVTETIVLGNQNAVAETNIVVNHEDWSLVGIWLGSRA